MSKWIHSLCVFCYFSFSCFAGKAKPIVTRLLLMYLYFCYPGANMPMRPVIVVLPPLDLRIYTLLTTGHDWSSASAEKTPPTLEALRTQRLHLQQRWSTLTRWTSLSWYWPLHLCTSVVTRRHWITHRKIPFVPPASDRAVERLI